MEQFIEFAGNHPMLSIAWIVVFVMIIVLTVQIKMSPIAHISPQQLTFQVNKESGVVIDIRPEAEFRKGHIVDAKHLAAEKAAKGEFTSLEKCKDKPIIVVCAAGMTAVKVANQLAKAGFSKVNVLKGGMSAWTGASLPLTKK